MQIKSILAGAAIALAATFGSASAADRFSALDGIAVEPMNAVELDSVRGKTHAPPGAIVVFDPCCTGALVLPHDVFPESPPVIIIVDGEVVGFYAQ